MANIQDIKKRLLELQGKEFDIAVGVISDNATAIEDTVRGQLAQGIKSDGKLAVFTYAPLTIAHKKRLTGLAGVYSHLTNYDTGESYRGLYATVDGNSIKFGTSSSKEDAISDRMDGKAFSPTAGNKANLIENKLQPQFIAAIRNIVKL